MNRLIDGQTQPIAIHWHFALWMISYGLGVWLGVSLAMRHVEQLDVLTYVQSLLYKDLGSLAQTLSFHLIFALLAVVCSWLPWGTLLVQPLVIGKSFLTAYGLTLLFVFHGQLEFGRLLALSLGYNLVFWTGVYGWMAFAFRLPAKKRFHPLAEGFLLVYLAGCAYWKTVLF